MRRLIAILTCALLSVPALAVYAENASVDAYSEVPDLPTAVLEPEPGDDFVPNATAAPAGSLLFVDISEPEALVVHRGEAVVRHVIAQAVGWEHPPAELQLLDGLDNVVGTAEITWQEDRETIWYEYLIENLSVGPWIFRAPGEVEPKSILDPASLLTTTSTTSSGCPDTDWQAYASWNWGEGEGPYLRATAGDVVAYVWSQDASVYCGGTFIAKIDDAWRVGAAMEGITDMHGGRMQYGVDTSTHDSPMHEFSYGGKLYRTMFSAKYPEVGIVQKNWYTVAGGQIEQSHDGWSEDEPSWLVREAVKFAADLISKAPGGEIVPAVVNILYCPWWDPDCDSRYYSTGYDWDHGGGELKDLTYFKYEDTTAHSYGQCMDIQMNTAETDFRTEMHAANRAHLQVYTYDTCPWDPTIKCWYLTAHPHWFFDVDASIRINIS